MCGMIKKIDCYGVELTELQNMEFSIYKGNSNLPAMNTISKEEAYKFADNLVITEEDEMIKTADMITWSDIIEPTVYADKIDVTNNENIIILPSLYSNNFWSEGKDFLNIRNLS